MNFQQSSSTQNPFINSKYQSMIHSISDTDNNDLLNSRMFQRRKPIFASNNPRVMNRSSIVVFGEEQLEQQISIKNQKINSFSNPKSLRKKIFQNFASVQKQKLNPLERPGNRLHTQTPKKQFTFSQKDKQIQYQNHQDEISTQNYLYQTPKISRTFCMQENQFDSKNRDYYKRQEDSQYQYPARQFQQLNNVKKRLMFQKQSKIEQNMSEQIQSQTQLPSKATLKLLQIQELFGNQGLSVSHKRQNSSQNQFQNKDNQPSLMKSLKQINQKNSIYEQKTVIKRIDRYDYKSEKNTQNQGNFQHDGGNETNSKNNKPSYAKNIFQQSQNIYQSKEKQTKTYDSFQVVNNQNTSQLAFSPNFQFKKRENRFNFNPYQYKNIQKQVKAKNIAQQLRQLHKKMSQKSRVCEQKNQKNHMLLAQNQRLLQENRLLKQRLSYKRFQQNVDRQRQMDNNRIYNDNNAVRVSHESRTLGMKLNVNKQDRLIYEQYQNQSESIPLQSNIKTYRNSKYFDQGEMTGRQDLKKARNESINYKIKLQKVKHILSENVLPLLQECESDKSQLYKTSSYLQNRNTNKNNLVIKSAIQQLISKYLTIPSQL